MLAVVRYKQFVGFYTDEAEAETIKYKASWCELLVNKRNQSENPVYTPQIRGQLSISNGGWCAVRQRGI